MRLVAVVPTHTLADGEYDEIAVGRLAALGFALQAGSAREVEDDWPSLSQEGAPVPITIIVGRIRRPSDQVPALIGGGRVVPLIASAQDRWPSGLDHGSTYVLDLVGP